MASEVDVAAWLDGGWRNSPYFKPRLVQAGRVTLNAPGLDTDNYYGYQCKDANNAFAFWLGHPLTAGDAITAWQNKQDSWYQRIPYTPGMTIKIGDHVIFNYNHIDIARTTGVGSFEGFDQNWFNPSQTTGSPPAFVVHNIDSNIAGVLRPQLSGANTMPPLTESKVRDAIYYSTGLSADADPKWRDHIGSTTENFESLFYKYAATPAGEAWRKFLSEAPNKATAAAAWEKTARELQDIATKQKEIIDGDVNGKIVAKIREIVK